MSDQRADSLVHPEASQESGAVNRMEAGIDQLGRIADIVKNGSRHEYPCLVAQRGSDPARLGRHRLHVHPPTRQGPAQPRPRLALSPRHQLHCPSLEGQPIRAGAVACSLRCRVALSWHQGGVLRAPRPRLAAPLTVGPASVRGLPT